jgi:hypothetical protein
MTVRVMERVHFDSDDVSVQKIHIRVQDTHSQLSLPALPALTSAVLVLGGSYPDVVSFDQEASDHLKTLTGLATTGGQTTP